MILREAGYEVCRFTKPSEVDGVDVVIVLGGDGAILHSALYAACKDVKIIGINYGNLGFLTEYEKDERSQVVELLERIKDGSCRILRRSLLQLDVAGKTYFALNEIALQRDSGVTGLKTTQILRLEVTTKEGPDKISGDGVLICTPTGSTAYSLSAGGAILMPEVPVFMLTPICAFSMRARPTVYSDSDTFTIRVTKGSSVLLADGIPVANLSENAEVRIKKAPFTADFPVRENLDFFDKVRNKLSE